MFVAITGDLLWLNAEVIKAINCNQKTIDIKLKEPDPNQAISDKSEEENKLGRTTSDSLKGSYQKVNASLFSLIICPEVFNGPHYGAGLIKSRNGSLFTIEWGFDKKEKDPNELPTQRVLPFSSILCIDRPLTGKLAKIYAVYYKGPFGETEFAFLLDDEFGKKFIERWKSYWLSQEPVSGL